MLYPLDDGNVHITKNKANPKEATNMKDFEKDYAAYEELKAAYDKAAETKDEAGQQAARDGYKAWAEGVEAKGKDYAQTFRIYKDARDNGNSRLDISEPHETRNIPELIANFRKYGVTEFTFSSGWSSAVEAGWEFLQNGCELAGMVEVFTSYTAFMSEEHEKKPAYLFRVK